MRLLLADDEHAETVASAAARRSIRMKAGPLLELRAADAVVDEDVRVVDRPALRAAKARAFSTCRVTDLASSATFWSVDLRA